MAEADDFNEDDFIPSCGDVHVTDYYAKKHFSELSKKAQAKYLELEALENETYDFLFGIEYHIVIRYMASDE